MRSDGGIGEGTSALVLEQMRSSYVAEEFNVALATASVAWDGRPPGEPVDGDDLAELGECWRFAMLAATRDDESPLRLVWRVRAMSAFVRSGYRNGAAMLCLPSFFDAVKDPRAGIDEVLAILDTMAALANNEGPVPRSEVVSSVEEKRGYYLVLAAEAAVDDDDREAGFASAIEAYDAALAAESSARRMVKLGAGKTTPQYLGAKNQASIDAAIADLESIVTKIDAEDIAAVDVRRLAIENLIRMRAGRRDLLPYEIT